MCSMREQLVLNAMKHNMWFRLSLIWQFCWLPLSSRV